MEAVRSIKSIVCTIGVNKASDHAPNCSLALLTVTVTIITVATLLNHFMAKFVLNILVGSFHI